MVAKRGFTLIGKLVVMLGLGILAVILYPVFFVPRESCGPVSCMSNLKQLGLGFSQYLMDYNEKFPPSAGDGTVAAARSPSYGWAGVLFPYVRNSQVFQCPQESTRPAASCLTVTFSCEDYTDFPYNQNCSTQPVSAFGSLPSTVVLQDGVIGGGDATYTLNYEANTTTTSARHRSGNNFVFADGHAKWFNPSKVQPGNYGCGQWDSTTGDTHRGLHSPEGGASFCID